MSEDPASERDHRHRRIRREIKWGVGAFLLVLVLEYLVLPQLGGFSRSLHQLDRVNVAYLLLGFVLETFSLLAYAQLTRTVLPTNGPGQGRLLRIDLSTLALSHVVPGGTAGGAALGYRLITQEGVSGTDTGFALAMQGVGSAVVLNVIFSVALLVSLFLRGYNPLYAVAAGAGVLLMATFGAVVVLLVRDHARVVALVRRLGGSVPFLDAGRLADAVSRFANRLQAFAEQRQVLRRAVGWAAANWLLDAASLWVCVAAFHTLISPIYLLVAYGLANILAVIPITPSGLGVVEGVLVPTLVGFGVPNKSIALLAVLIYRFFNFWLPIPIGGLSYLSLRFSGEGWRQRFRHVRDEVAEHDPSASTPTGNTPTGTRPTDTRPTVGDQAAEVASAPAPAPELPMSDPAAPPPAPPSARQQTGPARQQGSPACLQGTTRQALGCDDRRTPGAGRRS